MRPHGSPKPAPPHGPRAAAYEARRRGRRAAELAGTALGVLPKCGARCVDARAQLAASLGEGLGEAAYAHDLYASVVAPLVGAGRLRVVVKSQSEGTTRMHDTSVTEAQCECG